MQNARCFLGDLNLGSDDPIQYREVDWEEFRQAWHEATLRMGPKVVSGPHAKGFYFHDGATVTGTCRVDGGTPNPSPAGTPETETRKGSS